MHNLYANFVIILGVCKRFPKDLVNEKGNLPRCGVAPRFSDLEIIALSLTEETMGYNSECYLFGQLEDYCKQMLNLISHSQYNDRHKFSAALCETIRKRVAENLDRVEAIYVVDSKEALFREMLSGINDKHKPLLYAIAQDGEAERLTSAQFVKSHKLASASAVQYSAAQLLSKGVLTRLNGKYSVNDPFFALWINRMYGTKQLSQLIDYQEL